MQIETAIERFVTSRQNLVSPRTLRLNALYLKALQAFLPRREVSEIKVDDLRAWREFLYARTVKYESNQIHPRVQGKLSVYTIRGMLLNARQFFKWLYDEKILADDPARRLELPALPKNPPKDISDETFALLLAQAQREPSATRRLRNVALLFFLRDTGARIGGVHSLRYENLDLEKRQALVTEKGKGGGRTRTVYFTAETQEALTKWLLVHPAVMLRRTVREQGKQIAIEHVFVGERYPYAALTPQSLYCVIQSLRRKAGVKARCNPHGWRHARARSMLRKGAPLGLVSRVLGHAEIGTTDRFYGVYADSEVKDGYDKYA